nr:protein ALP1-like [Tanacetum cinerariifolium]
MSKTMVEFDGVPNLDLFHYSSYSRGLDPLQFNMDSFVNVKELVLQGRIMNPAVLGMIKSKFPFLECLTIEIIDWSHDRFVIKSDSLKRLTLAHVAPYVVNGVEFENRYYLADGIYPQWATFAKSFTVANDAKHAYFKKRQEGARKDVERVFGVLQGRWGIIQQPARQYHVNTIRRIMYSCIIMRNMILKDQKMTVFDRNDVYANPSRNMQRT